MIRASRVSGGTLIACHFPMVQLPTWQLPVQALCGTSKRSGRLCSVGLTRAVSLPERESLNRERAFAGGQRHFSNSCSSLNEDRAEEEGASDSSGRYDSTSSPEETSIKKESSVARGTVRSHNSFLPSTELDEDEGDDDSDGDNLHRYHEDSSFVLHGHSNWPSNGAKNCTMLHGGADCEWVSEGTVLGSESDREWLCNQPGSLQTEHQASHENSISAMACGEQDSETTTDNESCIRSQREFSPVLFSNTEYVSDSSCNSSDGILVNFCTMYNKSNNPATPHDLSSPTLHPSQSCEGSVFLKLQPVPQTPAEDLQHDTTVTSPLKGEVDMPTSASYWSPQGPDPNCNLYSLEPPSPGLSSLDVSDLTACFQGQTTIAMGTNQKYYKLVTCDLSSQSPSPAGSNISSCLEGHSRSSPFPPSEHPLIHCNKDANKEKASRQMETASSSPQSSVGFDCSHFETYDARAATTSTDQVLHMTNHAASKCGSHSKRCQDTSGVCISPSVTLNQAHCTAEKGACSQENTVVRYSKAQRPTSLPIQPFVLNPAEKPQTQPLGCLLEQYISHKSSRSTSSQPGFNSNGISDLQQSSFGSHCSIFLEPPSSSDTCSTCTPSPECFNHGHTWSQSSRSQGRLSPCASKSRLDPSHVSQKSRPVHVHDFLNRTSGPYQSNLVKIPTYQDLNKLTPLQSHDNDEHGGPYQSQNRTSYESVFCHTPPTLPVPCDTHHPNLQAHFSPPTFSKSDKKFPAHKAAPAADCSFFPSGLTAKLSSAAPLSSLNSLLPLTASGIHPQQTQHSGGRSGKHSQSQHCESLILTDRPPTEFCLSPDTSYESLSISHLQRRGLLRSVSRAVDLIMAHFGSSRDPEEKVRLGNSSWSPTIAGLVLEHLCPTIQNILEDGLRGHKLDVIIGQCRNHSWTVVEVSTELSISPSTRVLHNLVSKIQQCPQLTSPCMRLRAFIMGLLNLRALEFWLSHLHSQRNVVTTYYHSWGFLSVTMGRCQPLFQELLLLLQPLSLLPFDLNLLLEPRLLCNRQLCPEEQGVSPPEPCSALLLTSWLLPKAGREVASSENSHQRGLRYEESLGSLYSSSIQQRCGDIQAKRSPYLGHISEWRPDLIDGVAEGEDCSLNYVDNSFPIITDSRQEETQRHRDTGNQNVSAFVQVKSPCQGGLRWAKLFGAETRAETRAETVSRSHIPAQNRRRPSEWLHLDRSQLGLLAQSLKLMTLTGAQTNKNKDD